MNTIIRKRKVIDLDDNTFKILSMKAISAGTNLKVLIEKLLSNYAENVEDADLYKFLVESEPEGLQMIKGKEKSDFENFLGI